jgi:hypothetical protein
VTASRGEIDFRPVGIARRAFFCNRLFTGGVCSMNREDVSSEFREQVKLRAYDDKFIDRREERDILQIGIGMGMTLESARMSLDAVCESSGYILESAVTESLCQILRRAVERDGSVNPKSFEEAAELGRVLLQTVKGPIAVKRMVCALIDDNGLPVSKGLFSNWYRSTKRELGLA